MGKNTRPLTISVSAGIRTGRCQLELRWRATDQGETQDGQTVLGRDEPHIQEMVYSLGGELSFESETTLALKLPAAPHAGGSPVRQHDLLQ